MPNWANTTMRVEGNPDAVKAFHDKFCRVPVGLRVGPSWEDRKMSDVEPEWKEYKADGPECRMWNVIPAPEEIHDEYFSTASYESKNGNKSNNWYDWNIRNWGTKWDLRDVLVDMSDVGKNLASYVYNYNTAWGPPVEFMIAASLLYDVQFNFDGYEEGGINYAGTIEGGGMRWYKEHGW